MGERIKARSAVVILETAGSFVLEKRPDLPGKLAYPGKLQFFGGHREESDGILEDGAVTASRELGEEVDLRIPPESLEEYWSGEYEGKGKGGEPVLRHVSVYRLGLTEYGRDSLKLKVGGEIADVPKTLEGINALADEFTPFALEILRKLIKGEE